MPPQWSSTKISQVCPGRIKCMGCQRKSDCTHVYKCSLGHITCRDCCRKVSGNCRLHCINCNKEIVEIIKLNIAPRIGHNEVSNENRVTLEKLFQLPTAQLNDLFSNGYKGVSCTNTSCSTMFRLESKVFGQGPQECSSICRNSSLFTLKNQGESSFSLSSKKPLVCPHSPCGKTVTTSNLRTHFMYDHPTIPYFTIEQSKELHFVSDVSVLKYNTNVCLAVISVIPKHIKIQQHQNYRFQSFWLIVSGSSKETCHGSHVLYWLSTNGKEHLKCTIEISSQEASVSYTVFCSVNGILESQYITDITKRMDCLFLSYSALRNLLEDGPKLHLRVTIH